MRRVTIQFESKPTEAEQVDFDPVKEGWAELALEDGSRLRIRTITTKVFRLVDRFTPEGDPLYVVNSANIVAVDVPPQLRKENGR